jgi:hypothetical protein
MTKKQIVNKSGLSEENIILAADIIVKSILKSKDIESINTLIDTIPIRLIPRVIKSLVSRINIMNNLTPDKVWKPIALDHFENKYESLPYSNDIMRNVRQALGYEEDDDIADNEIREMSKSDILGKVLQWEGIVGYESSIISYVQEIWNVNLDSLEE